MILYFSGTGNTRHVAHKLAELLGDTARALTSDELRHPAAASLDTSDSRIVWAFPVYSWGIPPVVEEYIRNVRAASAVAEATHHMVVTCGDDTGYTDRQWRRLMKLRGWKAGMAFSVQMPNTYVLMKGFDVDSPEVEAAKLAAAPDRLRRIASTITGGSDAIPEDERLVRGGWPWVKSAIIRPWFKRYAMSPRPFGTNGGCTSCGLCARSCPMANITMQSDARGEKRPSWGPACALCLRCYHICPRRAVTYGRATDGKGQYLCR